MIKCPECGNELNPDGFPLCSNCGYNDKILRAKAKKLEEERRAK